SDLHDGPVTDYALNGYVNNPPTPQVNGGQTYWINNQSPTVRDMCPTTHRIEDGSSNTILVGQKALAIEKHSADSTGADPSGVDTLNHWDESIVQGGNGGTVRTGNDNSQASPAGLAGYV